MAGVPQFYRKAGDPTLVSYDFYDAQTGTGYKEFFGLNTDGTGTTDILSSREICGDIPYIDTSAGANVIKTFELSFFTPQVVKGDMYVGSTNVAFHDGVSQVTTCQQNYEVYHVTAGGVATKLADAASGAVHTQIASTNAATRMCSKATIAATSFAPNEKLRVVVNWTNKDISGSGGNEYLVFLKGSAPYPDYNPTNASGLNTPEGNLSVLVPFKVDT